MAAHLLFACFPAPSDRAAREWMRAVDDVVASHEGELATSRDSGTPEPAVGWRLMSDNHREIARACRFFASESRARADAAALLGRTADLVVHPWRQPRVRTTGWFVTLDRDLAMIGARRYENRSLARNAGALAVRLLDDLSKR